MPVLKTVKAPATSVEAYAFQGCTALEKVELTSTDAAAIAANAFNGCSKMDALLLRSETMSTLAATSALAGTKIANKGGCVYVPPALLETYRVDTNWKNYFISPIDSYPADIWEDFISPEWEALFASIDAGTYATDYSIGGTLPLPIGSYGTVNMQIGAFDADELAGGDGETAPVSLVAKELITSHRMNPTGTNTNGWPATEMRSWLISDILPLIPAAVRARIATVKKPYYDYTTKSTLVSEDDIWLPSAREVFGANTDYEDSGPVYSGIFNSANTRKKTPIGAASASYWWLRSAYTSGASFRIVYINGGASGSGASIAYGVAVGFAIGKSA